jgi:hypothetical protein
MYSHIRVEPLLTGLAEFQSFLYVTPSTGNSSGSSSSLILQKKNKEWENELEIHVRPEGGACGLVVEEPEAGQGSPSTVSIKWRQRQGWIQAWGCRVTALGVGLKIFYA